MNVSGVLSAIKTTMGGLNTQMRKLELISDNIANAEKTPDKNGKVYKRKILVSESNPTKTAQFSDALNMRLKKTNSNHLEPNATRLSNKDVEKSFEVVAQDSEVTVFEPNNPMADENGYVKKPDINLVEEMVDLISASRMYEANVTVMNAAKNIAKKSLEI